MHRFFLPEGCIEGANVSFPQDVSFQLNKVLRIKPRETVIVLDNSGAELLVSLVKVDPNKSIGSIVEKRQGRGEPSIKLNLFQALITTAKFEYVLQKGVETGVSSFAPFISDRTEVGPPKEARVERWGKIIKESAEQSGRSLLPELRSSTNLLSALKEAPGIKIIPWEKEFSRSVGSMFRELSHNKCFDGQVSVFIGPAGGFDEREIKFAREEGAKTVSLGNRVLRSETAGLVTSVLVLQELGDYSNKSLRTLRF